MPTAPLAKKLAKRILRENKKGMSYRAIARLCKMKYKNGKPILKAGTINRFAKEKGTWIPKDENILTALGLKKSRFKRIQEMSTKELLWALNNRKPM